MRAAVCVHVRIQAILKGAAASQPQRLALPQEARYARATTAPTISRPGFMGYYVRFFAVGPIIRSTYRVGLSTHAKKPSGIRPPMYTIVYCCPCASTRVATFCLGIRHPSIYRCLSAAMCGVIPPFFIISDNSRHRFPWVNRVVLQRFCSGEAACFQPNQASFSSGRRSAKLK